MADADYVYVGSELETFKLARNWKSYWASVLAPHVRGAVLEVGAGAGANIPYLLNPRVTRFLGLEPDGRLFATMARETSSAGPPAVGARQGMMADLPPGERFDTIVYLDVLEHIEQDRQEVADAASLLNPGGRLVVLAPAFQQLYSEFDRAVGHYRRYTTATLTALAPPTLTLVAARYLDAFGACLSGANRLLLSKSMPSEANILLWDRWIVPLSRVADHVLQRVVGRSVVCVWERQP